MGKLYKNGELIEYAEFKSQDKINFENYELKLIPVDKQRQDLLETFEKEGGLAGHETQAEDLATKLLANKEEEQAKQGLDDEDVVELTAAVPELATVSDGKKSAEEPVELVQQEKGEFDFDEDLSLGGQSLEFKLKDDDGKGGDREGELFYLNDEQAPSDTFAPLASDVKTIIDEGRSVSAKIQVIDSPGEHFSTGELKGDGEWILGAAELCDFIISDFEIGDEQIKLIGRANNFSFQNLNESVALKLNGATKSSGDLNSGDYLEFGDNRIQFVLVNHFANLPTDIGIQELLEEGDLSSGGEATAIMPPAVAANTERKNSYSEPNQPFSRYQNIYESSSAPKENKNRSGFSFIPVEN